MFIHKHWNLVDEYFVQQRVLLLARAIERDMARDLQADFQLTIAEWRVLAFIGTMGPSIAAEICAEYDSDPAEVCRAVARLHQAALIAREPDPRHQRKMRIMPTEAGQALCDRIHAMGEAYFTEIGRAHV